MYIRFATVKDAAAIREIYAPYVTDTAITFEEEVPSVVEFEKRIARTLQHYPYLVMAEKEGPLGREKILGYAYAGSFHPRSAYRYLCETTVYLRHDSIRLKHGSMLYLTLLALLKKQNFVSAEACIALPPAGMSADPYLNAGSAAFHLQKGFRQTAYFRNCGYKFGRWYDMAWYEYKLNEITASMPQIQYFPHIRAQLQQALDKLNSTLQDSK